MIDRVKKERNAYDAKKTTTKHDMRTYVKPIGNWSQFDLIPYITKYYTQRVN